MTLIDIFILNRISIGKVNIFLTILIGRKCCITDESAVIGINFKSQTKKYGYKK